MSPNGFLSSTSLGIRAAMALMYASGRSSRHFTMAASPCFSKSLTSTVRNSVVSLLRAPTGFPPGLPVCPGFHGLRFSIGPAITDSDSAWREDTDLTVTAQVFHVEPICLSSHHSPVKRMYPTVIMVPMMISAHFWPLVSRSDTGVGRASDSPMIIPSIRYHIISSPRSQEWRIGDQPPSGQCG